MHIKMNFRIIIWTVLSCIADCHSGCSSLYGSEPCTFLPAPPGKTPPCARPGLTFCEHPDHYPGQLIHYLVQKWRYDHNTLLTDESKQDFSSYFFPSPSFVYGPPNYQNHGPFTGGIPSSSNYYPEPIHIPKPKYPLPDNGINYIPPKIYPVQNFSGYSDEVSLQENDRGHHMNFKYTSSFPQGDGTTYEQQYQPQGYYASVGQPQYAQYNNDIWKRKAEYEYRRLKRSPRYKRRSKRAISRKLEASYISNSTDSIRSKRQSATTGETLCQARSQYIMPKAALNNKGNWMYVVNMAEVDNRYSQLVKSETCVSQTCNGICSLPQGYSSRCEQKYVQKRLVALEGGGNQLYTDVFWFPSCCVCTISNI